MNYGQAFYGHVLFPYFTRGVTYECLYCRRYMFNIHEYAGHGPVQCDCTVYVAAGSIYRDRFPGMPAEQFGDRDFGTAGA